MNSAHRPGLTSVEDLGLKLGLLCDALEILERGAFLFAVCDAGALRVRLMQHVREHLEAEGIPSPIEINFSPEQPNLAEQLERTLLYKLPIAQEIATWPEWRSLRERIRLPIIFVHMADSLADAGLSAEALPSNHSQRVRMEAACRALRALNFQRERLGHLNVVIVFWLSQSVLGQLMHHAADLFAARSNIFYFEYQMPEPAAPPSVPHEVIVDLLDRFHHTLLPTDELRRRALLYRKRLEREQEVEQPHWAGIASLCRHLVDIYRELGDYQQMEEFRAQAITALEKAISVQNVKEDAARLLLEELSLLIRPSDMPRKVELCEQALRLIQREDNPPLWAALQVALANALAQNPLGNRADNLEEAIRHYELALQVLTRDAFPVEWATTQNNLANAYSDRIRGERADNLEEAIRHYELALQVYTRDAFPEQWATTRNNLANAYLYRIRGERADNLEEAIRHYELALQVRTREAFPVEWATTQNNLALAYANRIRGARADNLEEAIRHYELALQVYTREAFPTDWAMTQNNLANAYLYRIRGERADNLEEAIRHYELALQVRTREAFPVEWATTQNNLANAYANRIRGERADNLEEAIRHYELALQVRTREAFPTDWAMTQNNLANAYLNRIRGARADNLEEAIRHYELALQVYTREAFPVEWATTQNNLANAYLYRIRGERAENLEQAIKHCELALQVYTRDAFPTDWAMTQNNLANAYANRIRGERADNLEEAIRHYELALQVYTRDAFPVEWAMTQNNLANAYRNRIRGERADNLEEAIRHYELALQVYTRDAFPTDWAMTQNNLANAYANRIWGERADNLEEAIRHYELALQVYTREAFPRENRQTARNLGNLYSERQNWEKAHAAYALALAAAEQLYTTALTEEGKSAELEENAGLYRQMVDVYLNLPSLSNAAQEAFLYAEEGRSRLLRDQLGTLPLPPPPKVPPDLIQREGEWLQADRNWENAIRNAPDTETRQRWLAERRALRERLAALWEELRRDYGAADYVALRRGERLQWERVQAWLAAQPRRTALLEFFTLRNRLVAFILRAEEAEPRVVSLNLTPARLADFTERFFREVHLFDRLSPREETWRGLGPFLLADVMPYLEGIELLYLVPHGLLHYLPLHALEYASKPLIEYFPIVYAPSAAVAMRTTVHTSLPNAHVKALVVGNPTEDLAFAQVEARTIAKRFGVSPLLRGEATKARVLAELGDKTLIHLSTHAYFHSREPFESGIVFAQGQVLTAREILGLTLRARLVVVSACQTAMQGVRAGDELVGLARAWLYAGALQLILSLWSVNDPATAALMENLYARLYGAPSVSAADALRAAMLEMRKERSHTYYWAPFILIGDWR